MFGDFDIIVFSGLFPLEHVFFLLKRALLFPVIIIFVKYRAEHFSDSVNKIFSDLCLRYVFACKAFSTFKHTPVTNRYKTFK